MMMPVERWEVIYGDGSKFTSDDGTWAEAPAFGVFAVVYYTPRGKIVQKEQYDNSIYRYLPDVEGAVEVHGTEAAGGDVKYGLWVANDQYFALFDAIHGEVTP